MKVLENVTKRNARVTFLLAYISRYIYRAGYVLTFKRDCYWIMNVPKRPKFRGEHYFRQGSNNFVRFYITRPRSQRRTRVSSSTCATCWKVHTFDRRNTYGLYVTSHAVRSAFVAPREISFVTRKKKRFCEWNAWRAMRIILLTWNVKM